jgi:hypothetical protein
MATAAFERPSTPPADHRPDDRPDDRPGGREGRIRRAAGGTRSAGTDPGRRRPPLLRRVTIEQRLWAMAGIAVAVFFVMTAIAVVRVSPALRSNESNTLTSTVIADLNAARSSWLASDDMMESALNLAALQSRDSDLTVTTIQNVALAYDDARKSVTAAIALLESDPGSADVVPTF